VFFLPRKLILLVIIAKMLDFIVYLAIWRIDNAYFVK
jgi:hypothetical protein